MYIPLVEVNIGLLANQVGVTTSDTLYFGQGVHNLLLTLNIGVEKSQDELEVRLLTRHERHDGRLYVVVESQLRVVVKSSNLTHQKTYP